MIDATTMQRAQKQLHRIPLYLNLRSILLKVYVLVSLYTCLKYYKRAPLKMALLFPVIKYLYDIINNESRLSQALQRRVYYLIKLLPMLNNKINEKLNTTYAELEKDIFVHRNSKSNLRRIELPTQGLEECRLFKELEKIDENITDIGKISGTLYINPESKPFHLKVYEKVAVTNPMHADVWPGLQDKENQAVSMCLNLYYAPKNAWGLMTGGGSISIFMACLAAKRRAREHFWLSEMHPEIIASDRTHPAFQKACSILDIKLILVNTNPTTFKVDINAMSQAITSHTIMLVASAPSFPEGIIDDVAAVAALADYYDILCHVDACLGGFLLPFADDINLQLPMVNFKVKGITSISADNHKYGLSEKGHSTLMFYDFDELGKYAVFTNLTSNIGMYATLGLEGSRPVRVSAWSNMLRAGREGYRKNLRNMLAIKKVIVDGIKNAAHFSGIHISGQPLLPIFAIRADNPNELNIFSVASVMQQKGWNINGLPNPPGFHFCITATHTKNPDKFANSFLNDLRAAVKYAKQNPQFKPSGSFGMYDLVRNRVPNFARGVMLDEVGRQYLGILGRAIPKFS